MHYRLVEPRSDLERRLHECFRDSLANLDSLKATRERLLCAVCPSELDPAQRKATKAAARRAAGTRTAGGGGRIGARTNPLPD